MAFWRLTKPLAPTEGITGILSPLTHLDTPDSASPPAPFTQADLRQHHDALDLLLDQSDLLSEIKSGSNQRLTDFLARKEVVLRLGGWVVWGLGRGILDESNLPSEKGLRRDSIVPDGFESGKVPDEVLQAGEGERKGMGGVPRSRDVDAKGKYVEGDPDNETEQEKKWANYPRLATEILVSESPSLSDTLFHHDSASSTRPEECPSPDTFLLPFWESILGSTELQLASRAQQVGFWAKVNSVLLDGPTGREALAQIMQIPHLPARLLSLLPFCSPINDLLLLLLRVSKPPSPLIPSVVTQTIRMLDPYSALGKPGHAAAEEFLRGVIEICLAVPRAQGGPSPGNPFGAAGGGASEEPSFEWRDTTLARKIADEGSVRTLLDWMLAGVEEDALNEKLEAELEILKAEEEAEAGDATGETTPKASSPTTASPPSPSLPDPAGEGTRVEGEEELDETPQEHELRTSSLIASIAVLVELIRKNNSDFVEQQMLAWARREEAAQQEKELLEAEGAQVLPHSGFDDEEEREMDDRGPSIVDLGGMLSLLAGQIDGFQRLIKKPRTSILPVPTVSGKRAPLTLERFRICELYAELLHCSNMSLVNRPDRSVHLYAPSGHLARGWQGADDLALALSGPSDEPDLPQLPYSPDLTSTSPPEQSLPSFAGLTTPPQAHPATVDGDAAKEGEDKEGGGSSKTGEKEEKTVEFAEKEESSEEEPSSTLSSTDDKRFSQNSFATTGSNERDLPATPSIYSVASRQLPNIPLPPGPLLKTKFVEHGVVTTLLDLFFDHPWNNFLHNVVFDLLQQIFHGRLDRPLDRRLAESVFSDARLCERILEGQRRNDAAAAERVNMRLGYMGHLSLIAEETVKLFERYPELRSAVESSIPQPDWDTFVSTTLRETRERDHTPLDGANAALGLALNKAPSSASLSDEDDEFPMNSARAMRAMEAAGMAAGGSGEGAFGKAGGLELGGTGGLSDPFSRYLADALSNDRAAGSSDEDEEDETWLGGSRFDAGGTDFDLDTASRESVSGFHDRFDGPGSSAFPDNAWPETSSGADAFGSDDFTPTVASTSSASNGFQTSFSSSFDSDFTSASAAEADDDFGDFEGGDGGFETGASITLPPMDAFEDSGDFDFSEDSRDASSSTFDAPRPVFARANSESEDGSAMFGRLSLSGDLEPGSPDTGGLTPLPPIDLALADSVDDAAVDKATSPTEPLGPSVHEGAHLAQDGFVEAEIEGKMVRVPADDIALAAQRRNSLESSRRPSFEG